MTHAAVGAAWTKVGAALRGELGEDTFGSWIAPAKLRAQRGGGLVLVTPTGLARDWIRRNAWRRLSELWRENDPEQRALELKSRTEFDGGDEPILQTAVSQVQLQPPVAAATSEQPATRLEPAAAPARPAGLQARYTFESFVSGPSNEFALSVARRVASWSDGCFSTVFFHGPYGFGKTHLLNAIGCEAGRLRPDAKIVYLTAEQFCSNFVKALMDRSGPAFKNGIRDADLLLVDDVHFIGGKKSSEEELFHTLAALRSEGRRIAFASDRPPSALNEIDVRLRSHLGAGLVCGIEAADRSLRLGILDRKLELLARDLGIEAKARADVKQFLADRFANSIRELEGALTTLAARVGEQLASLTVEDAQAILRPHLRGGEKRITVDEIQKAVAEYYSLKQSDLLSERRTRAVARPRQTAMYLAKQLTTRSYPDIGRRFGGRDHTTVLHAVKRIEELKAEDASLAGDIEALTRKLRD